MPSLIAFALGAMTGSFLNVCIFRLPEGESVVFPASHCRGCRKPIAWYDNVPMLSFLLLRGRCRQCGAGISWQYFWVELATALTFVLFYSFFGLTAIGAIYLALTLALFVETAIDFRHQIIPDAITLPGMVLGLALSFALPELHGESSRVWGLFWSLAGLLAGGGFLYAAGTLAEKILKKEAMGGGDVKLLAMIGAFLGWKAVLWTIFVSSFLGSIVGIVLRLSRGDERIPFGPYLGAAACLYLFIGDQAIEAYLKWIGFS